MGTFEEAQMIFRQYHDLHSTVEWHNKLDSDRLRQLDILNKMLESIGWTFEQYENALQERNPTYRAYCEAHKRFKTQSEKLAAEISREQDSQDNKDKGVEE